mmetsp:Transcript_18382/g.34702  ORF Transcript_18382/g.34702 Transcript_18382/m.34702 type:complete len:162 (-) Transcript_18382:158-643(-)
MGAALDLCNCDKSVIPNEISVNRASSLMMILMLQVLFGIVQAITGFPGLRGMVVGAVGYVGISSQDRYLINIVLWHALLSAFACLDETYRVLSVYIHPHAPIASLNEKSQIFHAQTAGLYMVAAYCSAKLYLELTQCEESIIMGSGGAYSAMGDGKDDKGD